MTFITEFLEEIILFLNVILYFKTPSDRRSLIIFRSYLLIILIIQVTMAVIRHLIDLHYMDKYPGNLYLSHFYFISQFTLLSLFYYNLLVKKKQLILIKVLFPIVIIPLVIQYSYKPKLFYEFNVFEVFITSFPIIIYSIIHLYNSLTEKTKFFYINAGILVYLSVSTLIFILGDFLSGLDLKQVDNIWYINKYSYIGYLILIFLEWKFNLSKVKLKKP